MLWVFIFFFKSWANIATLFGKELCRLLYSHLRASYNEKQESYLPSCLSDPNRANFFNAS